MMSATPETTTGNTLYDQIGGAAAVDAAVDIFYRKVLTDYRINRFFDDIDMEEQVAKQKAFFTMAFSGPDNYTGADIISNNPQHDEPGVSPLIL
jgi:hemoglobin